VSAWIERAYRAHGEALFRYLVRMSGDADTAADVLHDTFKRLLSRPPRDRRELRSWLFRVATNRLRDLQRTRRRRGVALRGIGPDRVHADPPPSPDRAALAADARREAERVLAALDDRDRAILLMREEGFTHREIAEAVGTTTGSVGTMIARALTRAARTHDTARTES
jgi:RNA polymerase sigma-70 factor (ECF subfamily)